jgi:hypothetical protein
MNEPVAASIKQRMHSVRGQRVPQSMLIPTVEMVADKIAAVPSGKRGDLAVVRDELAREAGAEATCPVTVQRHIRAIAQASVAAFGSNGQVTPFWRVVDPDKPNARRLAGGADFIRARQSEETARVSPDQKNSSSNR